MVPVGRSSRPPVDWRSASITAFYVDNGPHLPLWDRLPVWAFWVLPSAIGAPLIVRAVIRARRPRDP